MEQYERQHGDFTKLQLQIRDLGTAIQPTASARGREAMPAIEFAASAALLAPELLPLRISTAGPITAMGRLAPSTARGITLELRFQEGMDLTAFRRKVGQLQYHVSEGNAISTLPHGVTDAARRSVTRAYRHELVQRIESMYSNNPQALQSALQRLRQSDIDHILDLQLNGQNVRSNLKALHSQTNQRLGSQLSEQLPRGQRVPIIGIRSIE